jgi:predicted DCC family thiol-disulfide oxidoreductase YuxK
LTTRAPLTVFYNGGCSICGPEIAIYQKLVTRHQIADVLFHDISNGDVPNGFTRPQLLQALHAKQGDSMLVGVTAFVALWRRLPKFIWLARLIDWPPMRNIAGLVYSYILAPWLYRRFVRQEMKK